MMLIRLWQPPVRKNGRVIRPGEWQSVMLGGVPLRCGTEQAAEAAVRQLIGRGRVAEAVGDVTMRGYPERPGRRASFWKRRKMT